ncbi:biosynthetic-type acetolactate synthase large subunit [bacterium]|nr:MAG: biosynthetic-type acetolactate synthase large subunit [bacterium]
MTSLKIAFAPEAAERKHKERITGSEAIIHSLLEEGVDTIFGYPGGAIMPFYDKLYLFQDKLMHILSRHEQGAVHAAQGYARASKKVGVCVATSGPGATNLITGIADAMIDSTPLVCITGQVASPLLGTDAFQETDVVGISAPVTKWNYQITKASEIPEVLAKAFYIARSGRPGPVLIDITKDAQFGEFEFEYRKCISLRSYKPVPELDKTQVEKAADLINKAKKPYVLVGQGVLLSGAQAELDAFLKKTGIPAASTLLGLSALPADHPNYVGYLGMHGNYGPNIKTNECDVLIAVGMRFDDRVTGDVKRYAKQAQVIHIDIDKAEINKIIKADCPIIADAKEALQALTAKCEAKTHQDWMNEFKACDEIEFDKVIAKEVYPSSGKVTMAEVIRHISELTSGEAIVVTDVGQHQMVANRYYKYKKPYSNITSGGLGTMGFALPASMGAALGAPERPVIAVIGDGGFQMTIQELGTIFQFQIPVKILVLNNEFLGMVRQWQQLFFEKRYSATEMTNPDFVTIAKGYQIDANRVEHREELKTSLENWLNHPGPSFLEVMVEQEENVFPMVPTGASVSEVRLE